MEKKYYKSDNLPIEISESKNCKTATFLISVLDEYNLNGCLIGDKEGKKYCSTAVGKPIQAALKYDEDGQAADFGGHEVKIIAKDDGEIEYKFCTQSVGAITDAWVENREVSGYKGKKDCIMVKATLWSSRYPNYFKVFDKLMMNGGVTSSWEIDVSKSEKTSKGKKLIDFEFLGNCMLGSKVTEAVPGAGVIECSSEDNELLLSEALKQDLILSQSDKLNKDDELGKGETNLADTNVATTENEPTNDSNISSNEPTNQVASLTMNDIIDKLSKAIHESNSDEWLSICRVYPEEHKIYCHSWKQNEDVFFEYTYSVNGEEVLLVGEPVEKKIEFVETSSIIEKDNQITTLTSEKEELSTKVETLEKDVSERDTALAQASEEKSSLDKTIEELQVQNKELATYKEELDKINEEKRANELAEKQNELKNVAISSKLFSSEELLPEGTIGKIIEAADEDGLIHAIGKKNMDRLLSQKKEPETSEKKSAKTQMALEPDNTIDYASMMSEFLKN